MPPSLPWLRPPVLFCLAAAAAMGTAAAALAAPGPASALAELIRDPSLWSARNDTPPATAIESAQPPVLNFNCPFASLPDRRVFWDAPVALDLEAGRSFRFEVASPDPAPIRRLTVYFRSGQGWYGADAYPAADGDWKTIRISTTDLRPEGRPSGLHAIDRIRLAAWRGDAVDTSFQVRNFGLDVRPAPVLILRPDSLAETAEAGAGRAAARRTARILERAGVAASFRSDAALSPADLTGIHLVVLPHNPALPPATLETIADFLRSGGRLLGFYQVPRPLASLLGLETGPWKRSPAAGHFASVAFEPDAIPHLPKLFRQSSWNIQTYQIIHDETRAIAHWLDADGKATGEAAVFLSPRGALVTHILLDGDEAAKARALLSIASRLAPPVATLAAARRLESLGAIEPFPSWDELRAAITEGASGPEIQPLLSAAGDARSRAGLLLAEGRPLESLNATAEAEAALLDAYYRSRRPTDGEFRGLWRHQAAPLPGHDWEETVARLARHGFTAFFPNFLWGGVAFHPSEVLPVAALDAADDPLAACLEACRRHGIELHVWKVNFNLGRATPAAFARELRAAGRTQVLFDGSPREDWLCPTHPENRDLEIRSMVEVAERYAIDGVHFDYIRYPGREACFCPGCRSRFEARIGRALGDWPQAVRDDPELVASWGDFRREAITAVVRGVSERLRYSRPEVKISAAVFRHWPSDREVLGQDWGHWLEQGYLDFVTPMNYERSVAGFEAMTRRQLGWSAGRPLYPGIGFSVWDTGTALPVIAQIEAARRLGTGGYMIFEYDSAAAADLLPALGAGITAPGER